MQRRQVLMICGVAALLAFTGIPVGAAESETPPVITGVISDKLRESIVPAFRTLASTAVKSPTFTTAREAGPGVVMTITFSDTYSDELLPKMIAELQYTLQLSKPSAYQVVRPTRKVAEGADDFVITDPATGLSAHVTKSKRGNFKFILRYKTG